jgi:hypothetical protein
MSPIYVPGKVTLRGPTVAPLLLDSYSGAAAAYSLRQLSWAYGGPVVRVRRSNDNVEQDFTATEVSDGTLATWVGAGNNGLVRTWYDQSGNNKNAHQTTTSNQPVLVQNGVVLTKNGDPNINFTGSQRFLDVSISYADYGIFAVYEPITLDTGFNIFISSGGTLGAGVRPTLKLYDGNGVFNANAANNTVTLEERLLFTSIVTTSYGGNLYKNGSLISTQTGTPASGSVIVIGDRGNLLSGDSHSISELIFYTADQSANRTGIEANINAHYSIYP